MDISNRSKISTTGVVKKKQNENGEVSCTDAMIKDLTLQVSGNN